MAFNMNNQLPVDPVLKKKNTRVSASVFAIIIGIMTIVVVFALPSMYGISFAAYLELALTQIIITCALGALFLIFGIIFLKKDSVAIATVMLVLFVLYVADKIYQMTIDAVSAVSIVWLLLGIMQIYQIISYLKMKSLKEEQAQIPTQETTPDQQPPQDPTGSSAL